MKSNKNVLLEPVPFNLTKIGIIVCISSAAAIAFALYILFYN